MTGGFAELGLSLTGDGFDSVDPRATARLGWKRDRFELGATADVGLDGEWSAGLFSRWNW